MEPNQKYANLASDEVVTKTISALQKNGITAEVVPDGAAAKARVLELIPAGSEVMNMTSMTLEAVGLAKEILESGKYNPVRPKLVNPPTKESQGLAYAADFVIGSVHAVTEGGNVLIASNTGSQLGAYASGADQVIWVVSTAKIVLDLDEALRRIYEYSLPLEDARAQKAYGMHSGVSKVLLVNRELVPDRVHLIFVKEKLGF